MMYALIILIFFVAVAFGAALVLNQVSTWLYTAMGACSRMLRKWTVR